MQGIIRIELEKGIKLDFKNKTYKLIGENNTSEKYIEELKNMGFIEEEQL